MQLRCAMAAETKMPQNSAPNRNRQLETASNSRLPWNGTSKTKTRHQHGDQQVDQAHHEIREHLAQHHFGGAHGRGEQLLHGAVLPFARDGERVSSAAMIIMITAISPGTM